MTNLTAVKEKFLKLQEQCQYNPPQVNLLYGKVYRQFYPNNQKITNRERFNLQCFKLAKQQVDQRIKSSARVPSYQEYLARICFEIDQAGSSVAHSLQKVYRYLSLESDCYYQGWSEPSAEFGIYRFQTHDRSKSILLREYLNSKSGELSMSVSILIGDRVVECFKGLRTFQDSAETDLNSMKAMSEKRLEEI